MYQFRALIRINITSQKDKILRPFKLYRYSKLVILLFLQILFLTGCSDGDQPSTAGLDITTGCSGSCADASSFLTVEDVGKVLSQGIFEAQSRGVSATIAVSDRVGNILGLYRMTDANMAGVTAVSYTHLTLPTKA